MRPATRPWIWLLDPSPTIRSALALELGRAGWLVCTFATPQAALQSLLDATRPPCALLLELAWPNQESFALIAYLRTHAERRTAPLLVLTAHDDVSTRQTARLCGCNAYLPRPFQLQDVLNTLHQALSASRQPRGERPS